MAANMPLNMLAIETTCDETAFAIVTDRLGSAGLGGGLAGRSAPPLGAWCPRSLPAATSSESFP